jgi:hypothetical protein
MVLYPSTEAEMSLLEVLKEEEQKLERQLTTVKRTIKELSGETVEKVKKFSAATREKMAKAAKKRWAEKKAKG